MKKKINGNPKTVSENIKTGHRDGIWLVKMCYANNGNWEKKHMTKEIELQNQEKSERLKKRS